MKVLVTGGAGFIGSHFVRDWLQRHPRDTVVTLDRLSYSGIAATVDELAQEPRHRFLLGDIADPAAVEEAMRGCGLVVHFAAETHVDRSITNAAPFVRTNVEGTQTLLSQAARQKVAKFIHISTDEVYGPIPEGAHAETAALNPRSPYAASKAGGDMLVNAYRETYGLEAIIVRPTNVYGPRQFPEKFIPLCITNAMHDAPLPIYGDGQQRRAWLLVTDLCLALERIIERGAAGQIYNVSSPWERANLDVAKLVLQLLHKPETLLRFVPDRPGHDRRYAMDGAKLAGLGWTSQAVFEQGLRDTIAWYQGHRAWWQPLKDRLREDSYHWLNRAAQAGARQAVGAVD